MCEGSEKIVEENLDERVWSKEKVLKKTWTREAHFKLSTKSLEQRNWLNRFCQPLSGTYASWDRPPPT